MWSKLCSPPSHFCIFPFPRRFNSLTSTSGILLHLLKLFTQMNNCTFCHVTYTIVHPTIYCFIVSALIHSCSTCLAVTNTISDMSYGTTAMPSTYIAKSSSQAIMPPPKALLVSSVLSMPIISLTVIVIPLTLQQPF